MGSKNDNLAPTLLDYLDYRTFLTDWMAHQKANRTGFSLRSFTSKIGLASASFLSAVLKGKKNLSDDVRLRLATALGLPADLEPYFHWLVQFNQAKDMDGKNYCFRQLQKFRGSKARLVAEGQYRFYSKWYYAAVWNFFGLGSKERNLAKIGEALIPSITASQVEEAIQVLIECGLLRKLANNVYETVETHLTTPPEVASLAIKNHIIDLNRIAAEQLDRVAPKDRQYNTLMFQVSGKGFETIKDRIRQFQEELRDILDHDKDEDRIYTLSMSLFPNSQIQATKK
jgi:uncharacterized protein (TIGR02147 family)